MDETNYVNCGQQLTAQAAKPIEIASATMRDGLNHSKERHLAAIADIDAALKALEENPGVELALNLLAKANRHR